jgi:ankyrin repeat protein
MNLLNWLRRHIPQLRTPDVLDSRIENVPHAEGSGEQALRTDDRRFLDLVKYGNAGDVASALLRGADANMVLLDRTTPLFVAVQRADANQIVELLLRFGADVNHTQRSGSELLAVARDISVAAQLVRAGASAADVDLCSVMMLRSTELACFLIHEGADVNQRRADGMTPLLAAVTYGDQPLVESLLEAGVRVSLRNSADETPLHVAAQRGKPGIVMALLRAGCDAAARDCLGATPLHWAAAVDNFECVQVLVNAGADVAATAKDGLPPMEWALRHWRSSLSKSTVAALQGY